MVENGTRRPKPDEPGISSTEHGISTARNFHFIHEVLTDLVDGDWNSDTLIKKIDSFNPHDSIRFDGTEVKKEGKRVWDAGTIKNSRKQQIGAMLSLVTTEGLVYAGVYLYGLNNLYLLSMKQKVVYKNGKRTDVLPPRVAGLIQIPS